MNHEGDHLMRAVEFYVSCDISEETLKERIEEYRNDEHFYKCPNCGAEMQKGGKL